MAILRPTPLRQEVIARPVRLLVRVAVLVAVIVALVNYQTLLDEYALATYHPTADVAALAAPLDLTRQGQAILDRAQPKIDSKVEFNRDCQTVKGELELGCYSGGRIYILKIDNASLAPEMETVLAHEVLHAAWDRLSRRDQQTLGPQLETVYHGLHDSDLNDRMGQYAASEPGQETNELHSILGTEQVSLPVALTTHYARYFSSRASIVAANGAYRQVFESQGQALATQLGVIRALKTQLNQLNQQMSADKAAGRIAAYNALVPSQNQLVDRINGLIEAYDQAVDEYNALSKSLDSQQITTTEPGV